MNQKDIAFNQLIASLNLKQKEAVNHIDGPTMVVAGPGTGKTQILAARIANILKKTDTNPYQILCLTFTDAGVVAMRKRLESFIGSTAFQVGIHTFHSLCNEIIQFNSDYFGQKNLTAISELQQYQLMIEILDELPFNHPHKRLKGEVYYDVKNFISLFSNIKKENFDTAVLIQKVHQHFKEIEDSGVFLYKRKYKEFNVGDVNPTKYNAEKEAHEKLIAAIELFSIYETKMKERHFYDFDDMILWVIKAFKQDENFLLNFQEKYLYVLVDEFQDTNGSQLELVNLLCSYDENPNLFIVGDEDQSIYRFQGANINNILDFKNQYHQHLHTTVLEENYRSSQKILDVSRTFINSNTERIQEINKHLIAKGSDAEHLLEPQINSYFNELQEVIGVGQSILKLKEQGVAYSDIAILYRNHKHIEDLIKFFKIHQIPYTSKRKVNVLKEVLILKLLTILEYITLENQKPHSGEHLLFKILNFDFYNIHPLDIANISINIHKDKLKWRDYLNKHFAQKKSLFDETPSENSHSELSRLAADLEYWIKQEHNITLPQLIEKLIAKGGILSYIMHSNEKRWYLQMLKTFFDFVKELAVNQPNIQVKDLFSIIEVYNQFDISLDALQITAMPDSINLITLHSSKGLEFEHVFIIKCNQNLWFNKRDKDWFGFNKMTNKLVPENESSDIEEKRRLFYVGMTRAKQGLYLSFYVNNQKNGSESPLQFISEITESTAIKITETAINEDLIFEFESEFYQFEELPEFDLIDHQLLGDILKNYTLSATHLNAYLKCPISFYFNNILKIPSAKSEHTAFGTAVHAALEGLFREKVFIKQLPDLSFFIKKFELALIQNRDSFTDKAFERFKAHGTQILSDYYENYKTTWALETNYELEKNLKDIVVNGVPLKGKLDKLLLDNNKIYVVDYKTGKVENAKKKCLPPFENPKEDKFEEIYGGDYWRQMVFYKLLIENDSLRNWQMIGGEMDFVEPEKKGGFYKHKFEINSKDVKIVSSQIVDTYDKIKQHEFNKGCGDEHCDWCNFVKFYLKKHVMVSDSLPGSSLEDEEE